MKFIPLMCLAGALAGCVEDEVELGTTEVPADFDAFVATVYREPDTGIYIVDGDLPITTLDRLRAYHDQRRSGQALSIATNLFGDLTWSSADKLRLTYCVSTGFGTRYAAVVAAMTAAAADWELAAYVDFIHVPAQDGACDTSNSAVLFDVRPGDGLPINGKPAPDARSFFPGDGRGARSLVIHPTGLALPAPFTLAGLARHELGHILGFAHEHYRAESGQAGVAGCSSPQWLRDVTVYDRASVMHYRQCGGTQIGDLVLTALDQAGAAAIYGGFLGGALWRGSPGWCGHAGAQITLGDFNGDGLDDLLCHDTAGRRWIDLADGNGGFLGTDTYPLWGWCGHDGATLAVGDFNGDGRDDLLCYDTLGRRWTDLADEGGAFYGTDGFPRAGWCAHAGATLAIGDFNGDRRDDLLCYDTLGRRWVDYADASGNFAGEDAYPVAGWCVHAGSTLTIGDFNGDGRDDLFCHDTAGRRSIDLADGAGNLVGEDTLPVTGWCNHAGARFVVDDFDGDGRDNLMCHDTSGHKWIDFSNQGHFAGTDYYRDAQWCGGSATLWSGQFSGDHRADLLCRDPEARPWTAASGL